MAREQDDLALWQKWKDDPSQENQDAMLRAVQGLVNQRVNQFAATKQVPREALLGHANSIAMQALRTYKPDSGAKPSTWVHKHLSGLQRHVIKHQNIGAIPDRRVNQIAPYKAALSELTEELGQTPTHEQLAERLNWKLPEVKRMAVSLRRDDKKTSVSLEEDVGDLNDNNIARVVLSSLLRDLPERDRFVLEHSQGLNGKKKMQAQQIAKELNISNSAVSRIRENILAQANDRIQRLTEAKQSRHS